MSPVWLKNLTAADYYLRGTSVERAALRNNFPSAVKSVGAADRLTVRAHSPMAHMCALGRVRQNLSYLFISLVFVSWKPSPAVVHLAPADARAHTRFNHCHKRQLKPLNQASGWMTSADGRSRH